MSDTTRNVFAVLRGNVICSLYHLIGKCQYKNTIRVFRGAEIRISKHGKLVLGKGACVGERCLLTVRSGASIELGERAYLNADCKLVSHERIQIGQDTIIGPNVLFFDHDHVFDVETGVKRKEYKSSEIVIGDNCWIGAGAIILRGTHVGDNCVIGAGSVVKGTYASGSKIIQKHRGD